jgi:hypothetical protein
MDKSTERQIRKEAHEFAEKLSAKLCATLAAKPAPVDVEARLRAAGASVARCKGLGALDTPRALIQDGKVWLCIDALTLPRAEAALQAAQGLKYQDAIDELADAKAEIERLKEWTAKALDVDAAKTIEIARLKDIIESAVNECDTLLSGLHSLARNQP